MKYISISIFSMIITAFIQKVITLLKTQTRPTLAPNGLTPEQWEHAMNSAKIIRSMKLVLEFRTHDGSSVKWVVGTSLDSTADQCFMNWCWRNFKPENGYWLVSIERRMVQRGEGKVNQQWPLSIDAWSGMTNTYNALFHQAELRERKQ